MRCLSCGREISETKLFFIESDDGLCSECARDAEWLEELKRYIDELNPGDKGDILREFPHLAKNKREV